MKYRHLGDRLTRPDIKGKICVAVRRDDKCIRGRNSNMLVMFEDGERSVILARQLRKLKEDF